MQTFRNGMKGLVNNMSQNNTNDKRLCFETFAPVKFRDMNADLKMKHSLKNCKGCLSHHKSVMKKFCSSKRKQLTKPQNIKTRALNLLNDISHQFEQEYNTSFTDIITKNPITGLVKKETYNEKKKRKREELRNITNTIYESTTHTCVEPFAQRNKERMILSFE